MIVASDQVAALRALTDECLAAGDDRAAEQALARLWHLNPGPTQAGFVLGRAGRLPPRRSRATVAILRSWTVEPLVPVLRAAAWISGVDVAVHVGDFNTYAQEILDESSSLYLEWHPDVVILAVQTRDVAPELWSGYAGLDAALAADAVDRVAGQFESLIEVFRRRAPAHLLVHGLEQPADLALGLADRRQAPGQRDAILTINERIAAAADASSAHVLDFDRVIADVGRANAFDARKWSSMRFPLTAAAIVPVADAWLRHLQPLVGRVAKVLAVDLDNTIWGGVVGEDGVDGLALGPDGPGAPFHAVQQAMLDLKARGVLLAICSKNNHEDAMEALETHPGMLLRPGDFSAIRANWNDKAANLVEIARELNLGLDAIAFLDDNPAERDLVGRLAPEVSVLEVSPDPADLAPTIRASGLFERLRLSDEDRSRGELYARERDRVALQSGTATLEEFLEALATSIEVTAVDARDVERVAQLTQKTNQFNLTTRRYTPQQIEHLAGEPGWQLFALRAHDRFGDHGLVGVAIVDATTSTWYLDTFLLSCRVIGREVELALLSVITAHALAAGATELVGDYIPTAKNTPAAAFFERAGLAPAAPPDDPGVQRWRWDLGRGPVDAPRSIEVKGATL